MTYSYTTIGTCAQAIEFDIEDSTIRNIRFHGGCEGNLKAISSIIDGWTVDQIEAKCLGNTCMTKKTSCADQLAKAVRLAHNEASQLSANHG